MRTSVRARRSPVHRAGGARGDRGVEVVQRGGAAARYARRGWQPPHAAQVRRADLAYPDRALRPTREPADPALEPSPATAGGVPHLAFELTDWRTCGSSART